MGKKWPICAFHGGHENLRHQFRHMETRLEDDSGVVRPKLFHQIWAARLLSAVERPVIVYHPGFLSVRGKIPASVMRNIAYAVGLAEELNVMIALENMPRARAGYYIGSDFRDLKTILKYIGSDHLGVCFDWGHANNYAPFYANENRRNYDYVDDFGYQEEMISELNENIVYAHLHFNFNHCSYYPCDEDDEHFPLTRLNCIDAWSYRKTVRRLIDSTAIKKFGYVLLEVFPKRVFGFYPFWPNGASRFEQYESVRILRQMIQ